MNRLSLVLTYISGQVLIFWQEGQKSVQIDIAILEFIIFEKGVILELCLIMVVNG